MNEKSQSTKAAWESKESLQGLNNQYRQPDNLSWGYKHAHHHSHYLYLFVIPPGPAYAYESQ